MRSILFITLLLALCSPSHQQAACAQKKVITAVAELASVTNCASIPSLSISINDPTFTVLNLDFLQNVNGGALTINGNTYLQNISLPALKSVNGALEIKNNPVLVGVAVGGGAITGPFDLSNNYALADARIGITSTSQVTVASNMGTDSWNLHFSALTTCDKTLSINNNTQLTSVTFDALATLKLNLVVNNNPNLAVFNAPTPVTVNGPVNFVSNAFSSLTFNPSTVNGVVTVSSNAGTATWSVSWEALTSATAIIFNSNTMLSQINFPKLSTLSGTVDISSNSGLASVNMPGPFPAISVNINNNQGSFACIMGVSSVQDLNVNTNTFSDLSFPQLTQVSKSFALNQNTANSITATSAFSVYSQFTVINSIGLTKADFSGLTNVGGGVQFNTNSGTAYTLNLDGLQVVNSGVNINTNDGLQTISMKGLKVIGGTATTGAGASLTVNGNTGLVTIYADGTTNTFTVKDDISLINNGGNLNLFSLNALKALGGDLNINTQTFSGANTAIKLNALECAKSITIDSIGGLKLVEIKALKRIEGQVVYTTGSDPTCNMCIGPDAASCYQCGACLSCNTTQACDTPAWQSACSTSYTCPTLTTGSFTTTTGVATTGAATTAGTTAGTTGSATTGTDATTGAGTTGNPTDDETSSAVSAALSLLSLALIGLTLQAL